MAKQSDGMDMVLQMVVTPKRERSSEREQWQVRQLKLRMKTWRSIG